MKTTFLTTNLLLCFILTGCATNPAGTYQEPEGTNQHYASIEAVKNWLRFLEMDYTRYFVYTADL